MSDSATPWTIACPVDYSMPGFLVLHGLPEFAQTHVVESVMPSNHVTFCHPLLLLPSVFPSIRVFSSESARCIKWPKYWSFSFSISPSNEMCLFNLLCGQREKGEGFSAQFPSWAGFLSSRLIATADKECSLSRCYESGTALARLLSPPDTSISVMGTQARAVKSSCPRSACGSGLYLQPRAIAELGVMRLRFVEGCSD